MATVYEVRVKIDHFQAISHDAWPLFDRVLQEEGWLFNGQPMVSIWEPPVDAYFSNPMLPEPDFFGGVQVAMAVPRHVVDVLEETFQQSGELLPLTVDERELFAVNVTQVIDCLDVENAEIAPKTGTIRKYAFHPRLLTGSLFKIPQALVFDAFTATGVGDPETEFKRVYEKHEFTGLFFHKVWSDDEE